METQYSTLINDVWLQLIAFRDERYHVEYRKALEVEYVDNRSELSGGNHGGLKPMDLTKKGE